MKKLKKFYEYWFTGEVDTRIEIVLWFSFDFAMLCFIVWMIFF